MDRRVVAAVVAALVTVAIASGAIAAVVTRTDYNQWGSLLIAPILALVSIPILRRVTRGERDGWLYRVLLLALAAKLLGTFVRYTIVEIGGGDALGYDEAGRLLADAFRSGEWGAGVVGQYLPSFTGTPFIRLVTGVLYTFTGPTILGGFLIFSFLGFWGLVLFVCAFRLAVPDGRLRRYAVLVLFLPSLLFWPSSIGKETWMMFTLGLSAYGAARVLTNRRWGFLVLGLGLLGTLMVRPHITLILFAALFTAFLIRRPTRPTALHRIGKIATIAALLIGGLLISGMVQDFFGLQGLDAEAVDGVLQETGRRSSQGGSEFDNVRATSPAAFPGAVVQVLFRPFPFEANNPQTVVASLEGLVLLGLFVASVPSLVRLPTMVGRRPYLVFTLTFALLFILAFSAIGNFGILVRQRTQVYPFVLVAVALPAVARRKEGDEVEVHVATVAPSPSARPADGDGRPTARPPAGGGRSWPTTTRAGTARRTSLARPPGGHRPGRATRPRRTLPRRRP